MQCRTASPCKPSRRDPRESLPHARTEDTVELPDGGRGDWRQQVRGPNRPGPRHARMGPSPGTRRGGSTNSLSLPGSAERGRRRCDHGAGRQRGPTRAPSRGPEVEDHKLPHIMNPIRQPGGVMWPANTGLQKNLLTGMDTKAAVETAARRKHGGIWVPTSWAA